MKKKIKLKAGMRLSFWLRDHNYLFLARVIWAMLPCVCIVCGKDCGFSCGGYTKWGFLCDKHGG